MAKRMKRGPQEPALVHLDGGLCVNFVNTASARRKPLESYADLLAWGRQSGVLELADAERLSRGAAERPADAEAVLARARELRVSLKRIYLALASRKAPPAADLETLNAALQAALPNRCLTPWEDGCRWTWGGRDADDRDRMLWPVLLDAADVLTSKYRGKVRQCAGKGCDLLFVDRTAGSPRKWCTMKSCGARVKARRHYHKVIKPMNERSKADRRKREMGRWRS